MIEKFIKYYFIPNRNRNNRSGGDQQEVKAKLMLKYYTEITASLLNFSPDAYMIDIEWKHNITTNQSCRLAEETGNNTFSRFSLWFFLLLFFFKTCLPSEEVYCVSALLINRIFYW